MKTIKLTALFGAALFTLACTARTSDAAIAAAPAPAAAAAPALPDIDPAMWVVRDADTTIYLFGTFHMLDGKSDWFNDEIRTAFDASDEVVLEAIAPENPAALAPLVMKYAVDPTGRKLSDKITPAAKAKLDKELAAIGVPAGAFDMFEPWFVATTLTTLGAQKIGLTGDNGPEAAIAKAAKTSAKPVGELEGMEAQLALLDKLPEDQQIIFLGQTLDGMEKIGDAFRPMMAAWASGDTEALVTLMNEGMDSNSDLYRTLFSNRNANWAEWIDTRLDRPGIVFMAVGAGHLAGKDSVQDLLAKRGIQSARVKG